MKWPCGYAALPAFENSSRIELASNRGSVATPQGLWMRSATLLVIEPCHELRRQPHVNRRACHRLAPPSSACPVPAVVATGEALVAVDTQTYGPEDFVTSRVLTRSRSTMPTAWDLRRGGLLAAGDGAFGFSVS